MHSAPSPDQANYNMRKLGKIAVVEPHARDIVLAYLQPDVEDRYSNEEMIEALAVYIDDNMLTGKLADFLTFRKRE